MKTNILLSVAIFLLFLVGNGSSQQVASKNTTVKPGTVNILSSADLYELTSKWAIEYGNLNLEKQIRVIKAADSKAVLEKGENLRFISFKTSGNIINETDWKMVVGRSIIVPVINQGNPFLNEIMNHGVSQEKLAQVFSNPGKQNWGTLLADGQNTPLHIYISDDESVKNGVLKFLQSHQFPATGIVVESAEKVISALQNDPYAIGFCNLVNVQGLDTYGLAGNVRLMPVDKNGNGNIDYMEDIYSDVNTFLRGVWIGKYPKSLYSNIYVVSSVQPTNDDELAFLSWIITDGQRYMNANGFCELVGNESQSQLAKINAAVINIQPETNTSKAGLILLISAMVLTLGVIIGAGIRRYRKQVQVVPDLNDMLAGFDESAVVVPNGLYFDKSHTWAFMEKDGNISIGIDDFLQHITGPITRVEMKNPGEKIKKGDLLFSIIQSGKQLRMYAPVSGIIKEQNDELIKHASCMNSSPYDDGWVYKIQPANWFQEIQFMNMAEKHKKWLSTEFSRVKDFFAASLKPGSLEYTHVVLQDGGVLKEGILSDFGPEVWEDFQTNFLDNYK